jgi:hypothetical protein
MSPDRDHSIMRKVLDYLRANPQVAILLFVCVVLGVGTFIVVMISLVSSGGQGTGDPDGSSLELLHAMLPHVRALTAL